LWAADAAKPQLLLPEAELPDLPPRTQGGGVRPRDVRRELSPILCLGAELRPSAEGFESRAWRAGVLM
jgi:hypothetical protein